MADSLMQFMQALMGQQGTPSVPPSALPQPRPAQAKPVPFDLMEMQDLGNIDLFNRPPVKNADGTTSTVRSMSVNIDGKEILIPTVVGNRVVSPEAAIQHYYMTGEHLGTFKTPEAATRYADRLHKDYESGLYDKPLYGGR